MRDGHIDARSPLSSDSNLRCYDPEEELRENCQVQIAPVEFFIGAIGSLTVFTQLLHRHIDSQFSEASIVACGASSLARSSGTDGLTD